MPTPSSSMGGAANWQPTASKTRNYQLWRCTCCRTRSYYINTKMIQHVLIEKRWLDQMTPEDLRALTPLIYNHVNPYGIFRLDMEQRLALIQTNEIGARDNEEAVG